MANHAAGSLVYYLVVRNELIDCLAHIRHWSNLKISFEDDLVWVKDFTSEQIHSIAVKTMPHKTLFFEQEGMLVLLNHLLPERSVPSVLWTPIERALAVRLPITNSNYFGMNERVAVQLIPTERETTACALTTTWSEMHRYVPSAPALRLQPLRWCVLDQAALMLMGSPLPPLAGETFWNTGDFLLPLGFDFDLHVLTDTLRKRLNPERDHWILWNLRNEYVGLKKSDFVPLTRGSFHLTMHDMNPAGR